MALDLGKWVDSRAHFLPTSPRSIAGISGGSTSAMMAVLLPAGTMLSFQNTGREHPRTYDFLGELEEALGSPITWLEYRPPLEWGGRPCESRAEVVTCATADRSGGPFEEFMEAINAFRSLNDRGPIAPWWRSRLCTTYLKTRTARTHLKGLGWEAWDEFVGLRTDEQDRVAKLRVGQPKRIGRRAPLSEAGITKADVDAFWEGQPFKLGLDPILGNCTGCFLKDQSDLSRALGDAETDAQWWARMESTYPGWGGVNFAGYEQLHGELPVRLAIEEALREGVEPVNEHDIEPRRFRLVVAQEKTRLKGQTAPFACGCEGSERAANLDEDEEDAFILSLPAAE